MREDAVWDLGRSSRHRAEPVQRPWGWGVEDEEAVVRSESSHGPRTEGHVGPGEAHAPVKTQHCLDVEAGPLGW